MNLKIPAILVATAGAIGGTGYSVSVLLQPSNLKKLEEEGFKRLTSDTEEHWELKLNTYETKQKTNNPITFKKTGWEGLKEWCTETLEKKFTNKEDKDYINAKVLCSVPTNGEKLAKLGKKTTEVNWEEKATEYQKETVQTNLVLTKNKTEAKNTDIQQWCSKAINDEYTETTQGNYPPTLKWCTQEGK